MRDCPNCNDSKNLAKKEVVSKRPLEQMEWNEAKKYFVGFRFNQPFFTYYRCNKCRILYCPYYFNQDQLNFLYSSMPDNLAGEKIEIVGKTQKKYVSYLSKNRKSNFLLEIGSDIGIVTSEFTNKFKTEVIYAVEPNQNVHETLKMNIEEVSSSQLKIVSNLEEIDGNLRFDVVIGIHVFDHLLNPKKYLKQVFNMMKNNSELLIIVHNESSFLRNFLKEKWPPFCPQHPHLFNPNTITKILNEIGFDEIKVKKTTNWFSLRHVIKLIGTIFGLKLDFKIFDYIQLPFKLGNMAIVAKNRSSK